MESKLAQKKLILNNHLVNYYVQEGKNKPTLLFLHGWGCDSTIWKPVFDKLHDYTLYALDAPGFGASQTPSTPFTLDDYANLIEEFVKKLDLKNVILVGHSFGGRISIKLGAKNLPWIQKIALVDAAGIQHDQSSTKTKVAIAKLVKPLFKPRFMKPLRAHIYKAIGAHDYLNSSHIQGTMTNIVNEDLTSFLPKIGKPTIIIWGKEDETTPVEDAYAMNKMIAGSKLAVLENAGHFSFLDKTDEFVKVLKEFIKDN